MTLSRVFAPVSSWLYLLQSASCSLKRHKHKKVLCALPLRRTCLHLTELIEAITSCLLLTANSPCCGRGSNFVHNWKWLLWSICFAFVLPASARQALPRCCTLGDLHLCVISPLHPAASFLKCCFRIHTSAEIALNSDVSQSAALRRWLCLDAVCSSLFYTYSIFPVFVAIQVCRPLFQIVVFAVYLALS